jgi:starch synthase
MRLLFVAVEMDPLAKVGGLADVVGSLPIELNRRGQDARIILPFHGTIDRHRFDVERIAAQIPAEPPWEGEEIALWRTRVASVPVYLVENEPFFDRSEVYQDDDAERWAFFTSALLTVAPHLGWTPDVLHLHDWHPALVASRLINRPDHPWAQSATMFTIHNLVFRGDFDPDAAARWRLPEEAFVPPEGVARRDLFNAMAQGILHASVISTVSPTYAEEILTPPFGAGLDPLLRARRDRLHAVLNGIDTEKFDPATDPDLVCNFDVDHLDDRAANKLALQRALDLPIDAKIPLAVMVTRLYDQKGSDIAALAFHDLLRDRNLQFAVLGAGDPAHERLLGQLKERFPRKVALAFRFDSSLAQLFYGGSDFFLMPSRYEPCGLGQMIALRYGSIPIVNRTGGLADTVVDYGLSPGTGTGFVFSGANPHELTHAVERALAVYEDPARWRQIQERAMRADFSWGQSAERYIALYKQARRQHQGSNEGKA